MRDVADAIRYLTHNGPVWRALPADFSPAGTACWWMDKWQADGAAEQTHDDLRKRIRLAAVRTVPAAAGCIRQAGAYRDVLLRRCRNTLGRTMRDFPGGRAGGSRYLVLGLGMGQAADLATHPARTS